MKNIEHSFDGCREEVIRCSVGIIGYGLGNIRSLLNAFQRIGIDAEHATTPKQINYATHLVLPGVGSYDYGMKMLDDSGLRGAIEQKVLGNKTPLLGICLGAQMLGLKSDEGRRPGLGWIDMECFRFKTSRDHRVPHMGWNTATGSDHVLAKKKEKRRYYFVHSYYMECMSSVDSLAASEHGIEFSSIVGKENIVGTQFHPEKSHSDGLALLNNFARHMR